MKRRVGPLEASLVAVLAVVLVAVFLAPTAAAGEAAQRSPFEVVLSPGAASGAPGTAFVTDRTAGEVVFIDLERGEPVHRIALHGEPTGLAIAPDGERLWVSEDFAGTVAEIDIGERRVARRLEVGPRPLGVAVTGVSRRLVVANSVGHDVSVIDLDTGAALPRIRVPREPFFVAATPDGPTALAGNLLPAGTPAAPDHAACVSVLRVAGDAADVALTGNIRLPTGSTAVRHVRVSGDGRWAYVAHTVGRFHTPATQLERGWINTNALSIIDLVAGELHATVLLDSIDRGATDPWGIALSPDGAEIWITLRGTHELARVELRRLHALLAGVEAVEDGAWRQVHNDPRLRLELVNDVTALTRAGLVERVPLTGRGPRGIAISTDGSFLVVACYYSGDLIVVDTARRAVVRSIPLGPRAMPDAVRRGEELFHDATISFQAWLSCSTCHPDRGRNDALRWDLPNDGLGTPQMTRSLLLSALVAPTTARGVRADFDASVTAGFRFLNAHPDPQRVDDVKAYLASLRAERSPVLAADGSLTPAQTRGREIFEGRGGCTRCHSGPLRTDLEPHDVGSAGRDEPGGRVFFTPKLVELYRTAPYLHDGRAPDLFSIFREHDPEGKHGRASRLSDEELHALVEYLLTF